jgi:hypothetical protein
MCSDKTESASEDAGSANVSTVDPGEKMIIDSYGPYNVSPQTPHSPRDESSFSTIHLEEMSNNIANKSLAP